MENDLTSRLGNYLKKTPGVKRVIYRVDENVHTDGNLRCRNVVDFVVIPEGINPNSLLRNDFREQLKIMIDKNFSWKPDWDEPEGMAGENHFFGGLQYLRQTPNEEYVKLCISVMPEAVVKLRDMDSKYKPL